MQKQKVKNKIYRKKAPQNTAKTVEKRTPKFEIYLISIPITFLLGYYASGFFFLHTTFFTFSDDLFYILIHPGKNYWNEHTLPCIGAAFFIWIISFLYYLATFKAYMPGKEYGTAEFADPRKITKELADNREEMNRILSENLKISLDTHKTNINNNVFIIGGSGTGKSLFELTPNIYQFNPCSYIFTDPKGELLKNNGKLLEEHGYVIKVLDFIRFNLSNRYNPFRYIRSETDVIKLVTNLITNTTPLQSQSADPFWEKAETMLLQALFYYVWMVMPLHKRNFPMVMQLLNEMQISQSGRSLLDQRMEKLASGEAIETDGFVYVNPYFDSACGKYVPLYRRMNEDSSNLTGERHPAVQAYLKVMAGAEDTIRSIIISVNARLALLNNVDVQRMLSGDDIDIASLGVGVGYDRKTKTALFCVIPDTDKSYSFLVGMFYMQLFQELYYQADYNYNGRLPIPVSLWLDEFPNISLPKEFLEYIATMRSREIWCTVIIQNISQLKGPFKEQWEIIPGNCSAWIYLGGNEQSTHKYISESLGKWTIDKRSYGESFGVHGSTSKNMDVIGRELMTPDEVMKMPGEKCLVLIQGKNPVIDNKWIPFQTETYRHAKVLGAYEHQSRRSDHRISSLTKEAVEHYEKEANRNKECGLYRLDPVEFLKADLSGEVGKKLNEWKAALDDQEVKQKLDQDAGEYIKGVSARGSIAQRIASGAFSREQYELLLQGIKSGLSEQELKLFYKPELDVQHMETVLQLIIRLKKQKYQEEMNNE